MNKKYLRDILWIFNHPQPESIPSYYISGLMPAHYLSIKKVVFLDINNPVKIIEHEALLLGPIAVHPTRQGEGLGSLLIKDSLALAKKLGYSRILLIGDFPYYGRLGFKKLTNIKMPKPTNPDRILGIELISGAWNIPSGPVKSIK